MHKKYFIVIFAFILSIGNHALAKTPDADSGHQLHKVPREVQTLTNRFYEVMVQCPEKIWHSYSWRGLNVLFVYPSRKESYLWNADTRSITLQDNAKLPRIFLESLYKFARSRAGGRKTLSLNMEIARTLVVEEMAVDSSIDLMLEDFIFALGVHEFFHFTAQANWIDRSNGTRFSSYPLDWRARYYRKMLFRNLKEAFVSDSQDALRRSKFWYSRWSSAYPAEVVRSTDRLEGTARYADVMAQVVWKSSCSSSEQTLQEEARDFVRNGKGSIDEEYSFDSLSSEGYVIGAMASLMMRFQEDSTDWFTLVARGQSPLFLLLNSVEPMEEADSPSEMEKMRASIQEKNDLIGSVIDDDLQNIKDRDYIRISASMGWLQSNLMPQFFVYPAGNEALSIMALAVDHNFVSPGGDNNFTLREDTVLFGGDENPCQRAISSLTFLTHKDDLGSRGGEFWGNMSIGKIGGRFKTNSKGYHYLCLKDDSR